MRPGADLVPVCPHDRSRPSEGHTRGFPYSNNGKDPDGCLDGVGVAESQSRRVLYSRPTIMDISLSIQCRYRQSRRETLWCSGRL